MSGGDLLTFIDLRGRNPSELPDTYSSPPPEAAAETAKIVEDVRRRGDDALRELGERFDGAAPAKLAVPAAERSAALQSLDGETRGALAQAHRRILDFHLRSAEVHLPPSAGAAGDAADGLSVRRVVTPVHRAGLYVPGGRAAYPSTVLMTAVPARAAGVREVVVCTPPGPDGRVASVTLAATALAGVDALYAVGGAGAIAAMAYGTNSIPKVDVIAGPGNMYVALAKQQVAGDVGVAAAFTGPSEVVVVADGSAPAELAALDLIVQAEHGPDGMACLVAWDAEVLRAVAETVRAETAAAARRGEITQTLKRSGYAVLVSGPEQAVDVVNHLAPEHLQLMLADPSAVLEGVRNAGAVFCGEHSPAALGDYAAGPSHVLPTGRSARYAEALGVNDFRKEMHVITASAQGVRRLGPIVKRLAEAEGLPAHAESVRRRLNLLEEAAGAAGKATGESKAEGEAAGESKAEGEAAGESKAEGEAAGESDGADEAGIEGVGSNTHASPSSLGIRPEPRENIAEMVGYHSPQLEASVRLNTNESPFDPPSELRRRLTEAAAGIDWNRYPSRTASDLRERLGEFHSLSPSQVFPAKGSNEVIQSLCLAYGGSGRRAAVFSPTYALHAHISRITGADVLECPRDDDFQIAPEAAESFILANRPSVVFLCSPNNPTGGLERPETITAALRATRSVGGVLVLDEAYCQFTDPKSGGAPALDVQVSAGSGAEADAGFNSDAGGGLIPGARAPALEVSEDDPVVVTRTFSKYWTLAGARLGYALGPSWIVEELEKSTLPYHLDAFTQRAGSVALDYADELAEAAKALVGERERMAAGLSGLPVRQWPSAANFILFRPEGRSGEEVWQALLEHSVLVRNCSSWPDLRDCLRVTVGTPEENDAFLSALAEVLR